MSAVDFEQWATPDLVIALGGRTYKVPPPSVDAAKKLLAAAVRGELKLGLPHPTLTQHELDELMRVLDSIEPGDHPALGDVYDRMVEDGVPQPTIDRVAYYAIFYWARGKAYADALAVLLWTPRQLDDSPAGDASPKAGSSSPPRTGLRGGSASRTRTGGIRTTGKSRRSSGRTRRKKRR